MNGLYEEFDRHLKTLSKPLDPSVFRRPRGLDDLSETLPCVCPYSCASLLAREKVKLMKMQGTLISRCKSLSGLSWTTDISSAYSTRTRTERVIAKSHEIFLTAQEFQKLKRNAEEKSKELETQSCGMDSDRKAVLGIRRDLEILSDRLKKLEDEERNFQVLVVKNEIKLGEARDRLLQCDAELQAAAMLNDRLVEEIDNLQSEIRSCNSSLATEQATLESEEKNLREVEFMILEEKKIIDVKRFEIERKRMELEKIDSEIFNFDDTLMMREADINAKETTLTPQVVDLQRLEAILGSAEDFSDDIEEFLLKRESLCQERYALEAEREESEGLLESLRLEFARYKDENSILNKLSRNRMRDK